MFSHDLAGGGKIQQKSASEVRLLRARLHESRNGGNSERREQPACLAIGVGCTSHFNLLCSLRHECEGGFVDLAGCYRGSGPTVQPQTRDWCLQVDFLANNLLHRACQFLSETINSLAVRCHTDRILQSSPNAQERDAVLQRHNARVRCRGFESETASLGEEQELAGSTPGFKSSVGLRGFGEGIGMVDADFE